MILALLTSAALALQPGDADKTMYDVVVAVGGGVESGQNDPVGAARGEVRLAWSDRGSVGLALDHIGSRTVSLGDDDDWDRPRQVSVHRLLDRHHWRPRLTVETALTGSAAHGWQLGGGVGWQGLRRYERRFWLDTLKHAYVAAESAAVIEVVAATGYRIMFHPGFLVSLGVDARWRGLRFGVTQRGQRDLEAGVHLASGWVFAPSGARAPGYRSHRTTGRIKAEWIVIPTVIGTAAIGTAIGFGVALKSVD